MLSRLERKMFPSLEEAAVHSVTVVLAVLVLAVSLVAYRRRRSTRYLILSIAFLFLALGEVLQFSESYYNLIIFLPNLEIHDSHLLDLATLVSF